MLLKKKEKSVQCLKCGLQLKVQVIQSTDKSVHCEVYTDDLRVHNVQCKLTIKRSAHCTVYTDYLIQYTVYREH